MAACSNFLRMFMICCITLAGCERDTAIITPEVEELSVVSIRDTEVAVKYRLSKLGYAESGVTYSTKEEPNKQKRVKAIRQDDEFYLELNQLDPETTYSLQVYFVVDEQITLSSQMIEVTTTAPFPETFSIEWKETEVSYDEMGNYNTSFHGNNLNNINLKDLIISLDGQEAEVDYPQLQPDGKYSIKVSGTYLGYDGENTFSVTYKNEPIMYQAVKLAYSGSADILTIKKTNLPNQLASSALGRLYYFEENAVTRYDEEKLRFENVADIPFQAGVFAKRSLTVGSKIFLANQPVTHNPIESGDFNGKEMYSQMYDVETKRFSVYYYGLHNWPTAHDYVHGTLFSHNGNVYQAYTLSDHVNGAPTMPSPKITNYIARYNQNNDEFEDLLTFTNTVLQYQFVSVNSQLYAIGQVDNIDQGLKIGSTLAVFKVNEQNFELTELTRIGNKNNTFHHAPADATAYHNDILIAITPGFYFLFDTEKNNLDKIITRESIGDLYFNGFLKHKEKFYINTGVVYEISIGK